ncbi:tRNA guanosine(34) transglycosylase Tgt [Myxococcota bacterium]|nr:tRNA guanosine(34) transglycosylase Tgt [Myxococcota bacterium]
MTHRFSIITNGNYEHERTGVFLTSRGTIPTPTFMPVATYGVVRGVSAHDLRKLGAKVVLANTYHLHERPGENVVRKLGGLHGFTGWRGPWLTDSGGFQVTSLSSKVTITNDGVSFRSPLDGKLRDLTPENAIRIQGVLRSDIAMVLDHCVPVADRGGGKPNYSQVKDATKRTYHWAKRSLRVTRDSSQSLFGIIQGGEHPVLRSESANDIASLNFDGYAHGGLGLGEDLLFRNDVLEEANQIVPYDKPRYLMGLGRPSDIIRAVARGIDFFDCVLPTRHGRHGVVFTSEGSLNLKAARFAESNDPPDLKCSCHTCQNFSRGYLRHLFRIKDQLAGRLATFHNLHHYFHLMSEIRKSISQGNFREFSNSKLALYEKAL